MSESTDSSLPPLKLAFTDVEILSHYVDEDGKILPATVTRLNAKSQRHVAKMIKRARDMLLMR